jgi:hypothetical protein
MQELLLSVNPKLFPGNFKGVRAVIYEDLGSTLHKKMCFNEKIDL